MSILTVDRKRNDGTGAALANQLKVNIPIVFVSLSEDLDFNEEVLSLAGQKYCLIDYTEMGYNWNMAESHIFGKNTDKFPHVFHMDKWKVFDDFVRDNPPAITFCRELLSNDVSDTLQPISYPCFIDPIPIHSREEFDMRPLEMFFSFGISHEYRKIIHANIWANSGKYGYEVADNLFLLQRFLEQEKDKRKWASVHIPWWARNPIETITAINGLAKISVSPAGAGRSCFRHGEAPCNSVMLMWEDSMAWHNGIWEHGKNCIKCEQGKEIETIIEWLQKPDELYACYVNGVATVDNFRFSNYLPYLENIINNA